MKNKSAGNFFWASYTDLMISLFFVMLLLFVLAYLQLRATTERTKAELEAIKRIQDNIAKLKESKDFDFNPKTGRFQVAKDINFAPGKFDIPEGDKPDLKRIGLILQQITSQRMTECTGEAGAPNCGGPTYLLVIEGLASKDAYIKNNELSYNRALELLKFWNDSNILFDRSVCDVQIAGSGVDAIIKSDDENKNRTFKIQLVPIVPEIKSIQ